MKKKIFILILIVVISFVLGLCINYFNKPEEIIEDNSISVIGTIIDIRNNLALLKPQGTEITSEIDYIKFYIPEDEILNWVVGDIVKLKYLPGHITENNTIELCSPIESVGKERLFSAENLVPVSNADHRGNGYVFKSFFAYDNSIVLDTFSIQDDLYYKKIIPELRTLTENDFINYYLVIAMSKSTDSVYMFNGIEEKENSISLELLKNTSLSKISKTPTYSGVAIVLPNILDVPVENIEFTIGK